ncbi:MAG TPA: glycosyltransferase family 87 protein [Tepidisphaeraceae bacterium]
MGIFAYRTLLRRVAWQWDFAIYSAASRAWGAGQNPYDERLLYENWRQQGGGMFRDISWLQSIVPPTTLAVMYPFAMLPRVAAFWSWYVFNCVCVAVMIVALLDLAQLKRASAAALVLAAWILVLGPVQSGVHAGQPAVAAVALIVGAIWCVSRDYLVLAGALLGLAAAFKLQLAAPFILYYLLMFRWRLFAAAAVTFLLIATIALGRLQLAQVIWLGDWTANVQRASINGGPNDFTTGNPNRDHLTSLQVLFYAMFGSRNVAHAVTALVTILAAAVYAGIVSRRRKQNKDLIFLAPLAVLTLLPVYHRYYDASLLALVVAACFATGARRESGISLMLLLPFLLPVGWAVNLVRYGHLPTSVTTSAVWNVLIMSFWSWWLLVLLVVLLLALHHTPLDADLNAPDAAATLP